MSAPYRCACGVDVDVTRDTLVIRARTGRSGDASPPGGWRLTGLAMCAACGTDTLLDEGWVAEPSPPAAEPEPRASAPRGRHR